MSTFGGTYTSIASPQPGTTNTPFPAGPVPAFVPVVTTIESDHAAVIAANTIQIVAALHLVYVALSQINNTLRDMQAAESALPKLINDLQPGLGNYSTSITIQTSIQAAMCANQTRTNNFMMAANPEKPKLPPTYDQLLETIGDSQVLNATMRTSSAAVDLITSTATRVQNWILGMESYTTITSWIKEQKDRIFGIVRPPSPEQVISQAKVISGNPAP